MAGLDLLTKQKNVDINHAHYLNMCGPRIARLSVHEFALSHMIELSA